jgi:hypothetical protein
MSKNTNTEPRVTTTELRAYPGWVIRHNHDDGTYWADHTNGVALGPGEASFADALFFVKNGRPPIGAELATR